MKINGKKVNKVSTEYSGYTGTLINGKLIHEDSMYRREKGIMRKIHKSLGKQTLKSYQQDGRNVYRSPDLHQTALYLSEDTNEGVNVTKQNVNGQKLPKVVKVFLIIWGIGFSLPIIISVLAGGVESILILVVLAVMAFTTFTAVHFK